jgi:putative ABC transport system ATP-binding protein
MSNRNLVVAEDVRMINGHGLAAVNALRGVSVEISRGEVLLIGGPPGSGKTTLLQVIGALLRPTSGQVRIGGRSITGLSARALERLRLDFFGFVFRSCNLIATLNGWESVAVVRSQGDPRLGGGAPKPRPAGRAWHVQPGRRLSRADKRRKSSVSLLHGRLPRTRLWFSPTSRPPHSTAPLAGGIIELPCGLAHRHRTSVVIVTQDHRLQQVAGRAIMTEDGRIVAPSAMEAMGAKRNRADKDNSGGAGHRRIDCGGLVFASPRSPAQLETTELATPPAKSLQRDASSLIPRQSSSRSG